MKKLAVFAILGLVLSILLIGLVFADNDNSSGNENQNQGNETQNREQEQEIEVEAENEENEEDEFCGISTKKICHSNSECKIGGCANQVCEGINESTIATCDEKSCYDAEKYNLECRCKNNKCKWAEIKSKEIKNITFVPWQKRNLSECLEGCKCVGAVMSCPTETGKIMTIQAGRSGNIITIIIDKIEANTTLEIEQENEQNESGQNQTRLKAKLSNGRNAEIKIMPNVASERAIERLGELNFTIELKEVEKGTQIKLAYELEARKQMKVLGLFNARMRIQAQIDAENGEIMQTKKSWWAFLAAEE